MTAAEPSRSPQGVKGWGVTLGLAAWLTLFPVPAEAQRLPLHAPTDPKALEAFLDQFLSLRMKQLRIPGAAVVIVKDGRIFFAKGYGYANLESKRPVDPETTVFRVASVSKLFTATAVMQLVERGQLDLNEDVNRYLQRFKLPATYPAPVTTADLLTHTAGFDERFIGMAARTKAEAVPLGEYLASHMPPRVLPPGDVICYSNHGFGLAGYVVEEITGAPFARYAAENILMPLGMRHSSFALPAHLVPHLAVGYQIQRGRCEPVPFDCLDQLAPAGSLNATASDMARFMLAHLQLGRYENVRILEEATAREMQQQQFTHHPLLPGVAYGFFEDFTNGERALLHGGAWRGFASLLVLLPERRLGYFIACNRMEPDLVLSFHEQFVDRAFPPPESPAHPTAPVTGARELQRFAGSYRHTRYSRHTAEKLVILLGQLRVVVNSDATLTLRTIRLSDPPNRWLPIESLVFAREDGKRLLAFREDEAGRVTHLFLEWGGTPTAFERVAWYEGARFQFGLLSFMMFFFLWASVGWPARALIHRRPSHPVPKRARRARVVAGLVSGLNAGFFTAVALAFADQPWIRLEYGMPRWLASLFVLPFISAPLTLLLPLYVLAAWKEKFWTLLERVHYSLVTLAAALFLPFLFYWNLLGFRF